jgi:hypothetical protein
MEKEGLQSAIDFTKLLMALAGGGIALIIQPTFFAGSCWFKVLAVGALLFLAICVVSGLFVASAGAVMLANKNYNLEYRFLKLPGLTNVFTFGIGFLFLAVAVAIRLFES